MDTERRMENRGDGFSTVSYTAEYQSAPLQRLLFLAAFDVSSPQMSLPALAGRAPRRGDERQAAS